MLTIPEIKSAVTKIGQYYGIKSAYLFGSYAKSTATETSDVDILIDRGAIRGYLQLNGFRLALTAELGTEVDLVTITSVPTSFLNSIKPTRILLYAS